MTTYQYQNMGWGDSQPMAELNRLGGEGYRVVAAFLSDGRTRFMLERAVEPEEFDGEISEETVRQGIKDAISGVARTANRGWDTDRIADAVLKKLYDLGVLVEADS